MILLILIVLGFMITADSKKKEENYHPLMPLMSDDDQFLFKDFSSFSELEIVPLAFSFTPLKKRSA